MHRTLSLSATSDINMHRTLSLGATSDKIKVLIAGEKCTILRVAWDS